MEIAEIVSNHWIQLREMTYDLLEVLEVSDLGLKLEFERSQSIGYQFWCMLGAQESWISLIESGEWGGFSCSVKSLEGSDVLENFKNQMLIADKVQNRKDFLKFHQDAPPPGIALLDMYFEMWLAALGISEEMYQKLTGPING